MKTLLTIFTLVFTIGIFVSAQSSYADTKNARAKFIRDWNKVVKKPADLTEDTIVVYTSKTQNPFRTKNDWAGEFHPRTVNGQTCKELGIKFIQVRNRRLNKMLSGIICKDR